MSWGEQTWAVNHFQQSLPCRGYQNEALLGGQLGLPSPASSTDFRESCRGKVRTREKQWDREVNRDGERSWHSRPYSSPSLTSLLRCCLPFAVNSKCLPIFILLPVKATYSLRRSGESDWQIMPLVLTCQSQALLCWIGDPGRHRKVTGRQVAGCSDLKQN